MNENQSPQDYSLEEFIDLPDTIPIVLRNGTVGSEVFRQRHNIRKGTSIYGEYSVDYVDQSAIGDIVSEVRSDELNMIPIVLGLMDQHNLEEAGILQVHRQSYLDLLGRGTLLGFVDTGIDYTKKAFQYEDGSSKIKYIWDQTIAGSAPENYYFGTQYTDEDITEALREENPFAVLPHRDDVGHGTFLASLAASREEGDYLGVAPEAEIIAVKMRKAKSFFYERFLIPPEQENAYASSDLLLGIQYIIDKADEMGRPVAICIAVGSNLSGHDGFSTLEEYLRAVANVQGVAVVCAGGNESQAGRHASGRISKSGDIQNIELVVGAQANDIYLSLWNGAADRMAVSIVSPTGEVIPKIPVRSGSSYSTNLVMERSRVMVEYNLPVSGSGDQFTRIKIFTPTIGIWRISVHGEIILNGTFHAWLPISGFIDPSTAFLTPSPNSTIVVPATAVGIICCGAYDGRSNAIYSDSSWGPTRLMRMAPDLVAPGVNVGGIFPTGYGRMSGTSVSAAIATGACALMLQWGVVEEHELSMTTAKIRANLIRGCARDGSMEYPNAQWGYGKLDLYNTLNVIRPL